MRIIGGRDSGRKILAPKSQNTRPSSDRVKESFFNIMQNKIKGRVCLDLFAGSGAIGLEFISRGASLVYFSDISRESINVINKNIRALNYEDRARVLKMDYRKVLSPGTINDTVDIVYVDPPYSKGIEGDVLSLLKESELLKDDSLIIVESEKVLNEYDGYNKIDERKYGRAILTFFERI